MNLDGVLFNLNFRKVTKICPDFLILLPVVLFIFNGRLKVLKPISLKYMLFEQDSTIFQQVGISTGYCYKKGIFIDVINL